jgi:hypothetical protein
MAVADDMAHTLVAVSTARAKCCRNGNDMK